MDISACGSGVYSNGKNSKLSWKASSWSNHYQQSIASSFKVFSYHRKWDEAFFYLKTFHGALIYTLIIVIRREITFRCIFFALDRFLKKII
jgi:hypothetical protein